MDRFLYLFIDILSFAVPFLYSFEKKRVHFIQYWKPYFLSLFIVGFFFIVWDVYFTAENVWGFNDRYLLGIRFLGLPIEEWLFFTLIPYSSNFIHYALLYFFPKPRLSKSFTNILTWSLMIMAITVALTNYDKMYTFSSFGLFALLLAFQLYKKYPFLERYYLSFIIIYLPFFLVNSWLTGSFTEEPVVFYNDNENLGIRLGTMPLEDSFYCFTMLYSSLILFENLKLKIQ